MDWKPPRTDKELEEVFSQAMADRAYFERIIRFTYKMKWLEWYTIDRFVKPENQDLFKNCICLLIAWNKFSLEFNSTYQKIRKY